MIMNSNKKEDICPNCGTACFATDVLCSGCGKNLDELFEQLSDLKEGQSIFRNTVKQLALFNWLVPLLLVLSPMLVSLITAFPFALDAAKSPERGSLQLIGNVVPSSALIPSVIVLAGVTPLLICTTPRIRKKLGKRSVVNLAVLFSVLSVITIWLGLVMSNIFSVFDSFAYFGGLVQVYKPAEWVYFIIAGCVFLIAINLIAILNHEKTA